AMTVPARTQRSCSMNVAPAYAPVPARGKPAARAIAKSRSGCFAFRPPAGRPPRMTVYVDDPVTPWRGRRWAHLMADTLGELHDFAARLGLPRRAFQNKTSGAHYDITADMRLQAIALGAMPISRHKDRELVKAVIANARAQGRGERP